MKKYILIQNDGEIESNSFELIGASTKRSDNTKIGFFGSGLKYSIAYMMRSDIGFKVFSGMKEFLFTTKSENLRDQIFERICINGTPTSFTTTMGPTWKEDWFVLREIYCNALDETGCQIVKETEIAQPSEGKTRVYIEVTEKLKDVCSDWDAYFADERTPIFTTKEIYTCFLGYEDGGVNSQKIEVFPKTKGVLYRKGIRVYQNKRYMFDYNVGAVNINEDRTAKNPMGLHYGIYGLFASFQNEYYIKSVLRGASDDEQPEEYVALNVSSQSLINWSSDWIVFSKENLLVIKESSGKYAEDIVNSKKECFLIPTSFARELKKALPEVGILGMGSVLSGVAANEVEMTPKMNFLLKEVMGSLKEMKYEVTYPIKVVDFDDEDVLGKADIKEKQILISQKAFDMGRREIALILIEETEHIISQKEDETRAFQTHIFSQWLKTMEDSNGLFL